MAAATTHHTPNPTPIRLTRSKVVHAPQTHSPPPRSTPRQGLGARPERFAIPSARKQKALLPRGGMDQKEQQIEKARELQSTIEQMTTETTRLEDDLRGMGQEQTQIVGQIQQLQARSMQIQAEIGPKQQRLQDISLILQAKEAEYMKILEAQPTLVHVLKKK